ncbi:hypothetical protein OG500_17110 [Kitasatospora sp. NBC_01250]|uniref:hypothetical protein n=1 Tax=unclassified Kitasatospora TaxID=2633591 RepID=UPI002E101B3B|nr:MULTISPECIES: hypothetical protein [unclassified Kitasatospora]WSJ67879.1 hypothetical protein OG294_18120 [Kitasatospora sp. NBC_01302]
MLSVRTRRATAAGATALTALLTAGLTALPAHAAAGKLTISGDAANALAADGTPKQVQLRIDEPGAASNEGLTYTFDTSALTGIATFRPSASCNVKGTVVSCTDSMGPYAEAQPQLNFAAVAGAKPGASAKLHLTATTDDGATTTFDTALTVGGTKLSVQQIPAQNGVKIGSTVGTGLEITNNGTLASTQTNIEIFSSVALPFHQQYGNCKYGKDANGIASTAVCTIDTGIAPGETVHLDPMQFDVSSQALEDFVEFAVSPQPYDLTRFSTETFTQGSGPHLTLGKPETPGQGPSTVADLGTNSGAELDVTAVNHADYVALGSWQPQAGGKQGTLQVGLRNDGPALYSDRAGSSIADLQVILPAGVKATTVPSGCLLQTHLTDAANRTMYRCDTKDTQPAGFKITFNFGIQVDDPSAVRNGLVDFVNGEAPSDFDATDKLDFDPNPANNSVQLAFGTQAAATPSAAPTGAAPVAATSAAPTTAAPVAPATPAARATEAAAKPAGQELAFTGGGSDAGAIAAAGGAAVLLGAGALVYAARRRKAGAQH